MTRIEVFNAIRAFNERLRQARRMYGEKSNIVDNMIGRAMMMTDLTWTGSTNIAKGKANIDVILSNPYNIRRFQRYIMENSVTYFMNTRLTPKQIKDINKMKGQARLNEISNKLNKTLGLSQMYNTIYQDIYDATRDNALTKQLYTQLRNGHDDIIKQYFAGELTISEVIDYAKKLNTIAKYPDLAAAGVEPEDLEEYGFDDF